MAQGWVAIKNGWNSATCEFAEVLTARFSGTSPNCHSNRRISLVSDGEIGVRNNPTWFESMPHWLENDRSWECFSLRVIMVLNLSMTLSTALPLTATEDYNVWNVSVCETPTPSTTSWSLWGLVRLSLCRHNCLNSVFFDNSVLNTITPPQQVMIMCEMSEKFVEIWTIRR